MKQNGLHKIKEIEYLYDYDPRLDPTVVPLPTASDEPLPLTELPSPGAQISNYHTCADYHVAYKSGKVTPSDVVEYLLPLIRRDMKPTGPYSVAFIDTNVELVRAAAKASTQRYRNGQPLSPLDGVPLAVKDELHMTGYKRKMGSKVDFSDPKDRTAWCVQKWQDAGGVVIG